MSRTKMLRDGLFMAVTAAALGFGATQAFAAPSEGASRFACNPWDGPRCVDYCQAKGADTGYCQEGAIYNCKCVWY